MVTTSRARDRLVRRAVRSARPVLSLSVALSGVAVSSQWVARVCRPSRRRRAAVRVSPVTSGAAVSMAAMMAAPVVSSAVPVMANPPSSMGEKVMPARS